jgi:ABC-2 type transport system permease protein
VRKIWLVAKHEYLKLVKKKSFLLSALGIPLLMVAIAGITILVMLGNRDARPLGYIDHAGVLNPETLPALQEEQRRFADIRPYPDEEAARADLKSGAIQAYYVVPEHYLETRSLHLTYGEDEPSEGVRGDFADYLQASLIDTYSPEVRTRLSEGINLTVRSADERRVLDQDNVLSFILPFAVTFALFIAIATAGGYLLQAVTEEKENRTMEILATSLSPGKLMTGKALGLMAVSLTQILAWTLALIIGVTLVQAFGRPMQITVPWGMMAIIILYFIPTYALIAGMMTTIGAMVTELQQGQQITGLINMLFIAPTFFIAVMIEKPDSAFLVAMTLFPTTSFLTILLRWSMASVPLWQMIVSWVILTGSAAFSIWMAGRVFRMGMLRYGQRLRLNNVIDALRGKTAALKKEAANHA